MKKRIIVLFLVCMMVFTLAGCTDVAEITNDGMIEQGDSNIKVYDTDEVDSYLSFLETFDEKEYEILGISTSTGGNGTYRGYVVTYQKLQEPKTEVKKTGKVYLFQTWNEDEYKSFLSNFDNSQYETLNVSMSVGRRLGHTFYSYMVTYREIKEQ